MSEKHLTELPWKTLVVKQGVKDLGLQKALVAYAKLDATKEPEKTLEALKEIGELAAKLKKTNAAKEEVVAHLDEVIKEVKKTTPVLEARIKPAAAATVKPGAAAKPGAKPAAKDEDEDEDEDEGETAAEFKKDLKKQMVSALAQVKLRAPGDPEQEKEPKPQLKFMAYLAAKNSAVIVARKVGTATKKLLPDIAGVATGGKFVQGDCIFEKNAHTFVLEQVPGGLAKKLAKALNAETGQKYKVRVRNTDGSVTLDSDTDVDPEAATGGGDPAAEWKAKLAEWTPAIKVALAAKGPNAAAMAKLLTQAIALSKPGGDMVQALAKLTECHALATSVAPTAAPDQAATAPATPATAQEAAPVSNAAGQQVGEVGLVQFAKLRLLWQSAKQSVAGELLQLENMVRGEMADDSMIGNLKRLSEILAAFNEGLSDTLDNLADADTPEKRRTAAQAAQVATDHYIDYVVDDNLIEYVETNPFMDTRISGHLLPPLSAISSALGSISRES